jgi:hypothetical protein
MKLLKPIKKLASVAIAFLLVLLILKIVLLLISKPKITIDYVAEYNKFTRPKNYDLNENASLYYQKAFDVLVSMPDELWKPYNEVWPTDFNSNEQSLLEEWLVSNSQSFELFRIAANKPYYWLERKTEKSGSVAEYKDFSCIMLPELSPFHKLTEAIIWNAKLKASKGQLQSAFEDILNCYRAGGHKCRPELLNTEQFIGLAIKKNAIQGIFVILDRVNCDYKSLEMLQDKLQREFDNDTYIPNIEAEKFFLYDVLQRTFLDNGKGAGRLSWQMCWDASSGCTDLTSKWPAFSQIIWPNLKLRLNCFIGPTRNETTEKIEQTITISNQMMVKTPRQIKNERRNYLGEIENINNSNFLLKLPIGIKPKGIYQFYYDTKVWTEALLVVLAILRYEAETNQFPETLSNLVSKGYLKAIPQDPYSNDSLIYKISEDNFVLYGIGGNFTDDGGKRGTDDIVFWPVQERPKRTDPNQPLQSHSE